MSQIKIDYVISYSSEDKICKVRNLVLDSLERPWLCALDDKSGRLVAELQLSRLTTIDFIDIGNHGCSSIEIQVGLFSFSNETTYVPFLLAENLGTPDIMSNYVNNFGVLMFNKNDFSSDAREKQWDRIKIICRQTGSRPFQFGLKFVHLRTKESDSASNMKTSTSSRKTGPWCVPESFLKQGEKPTVKKPSSSRTGIPLFFSINLTDINSTDINSTAIHSDLDTNPIESSAFIDDLDTYLFAFMDDDDIWTKSLKGILLDFEDQRRQKLTPLEELFFYNKVHYMKKHRSKFENFCSENTEDIEFKGKKKNRKKIRQTVFSADDSSNGPGKKFKMRKKFRAEVTQDLVITRASADTNHSDAVDKKRHKSSDICEQPFVIKLYSCENNNHNNAASKKRQQSPDIDDPFVTRSSSAMQSSAANSSCGVEGSNESEIKQPPASSGVYYSPQELFQHDGEQPSTSSGVYHSTPESIQHDGEQSSTSSGISYMNCPICYESFSTIEIERHAATCGEPQAYHATIPPVSIYEDASSDIEEVWSNVGELSKTNVTTVSVSSSNPEVTFSEATSSIPEEIPNFPEATAGVPEATAGVPEETAGVPEETAGVPEETAGVPEATAGVPEATASVPEATASVLEATPSIESSTGTEEQSTSQTTVEYFDFDDLYDRCVLCNEWVIKSEIVEHLTKCGSELSFEQMMCMDYDP